MARVLAWLSLATSVSMALVRAYSAEPVSAEFSGWTQRLAPGNAVAEVVTCCWDSLNDLSYVELFVGFIGTGSDFDLNVYDDETNGLVAHRYYVTPEQGHYWLRFDTLDIDGAFVKGRKYRFEFTRSEGSPDSINYYTDIGTVYPYG